MTGSTKPVERSHGRGLIARLLAIAFVFASVPAAADTVVLNTPDHVASTTGLINLGLGEIHQWLKVRGWDDIGADPAADSSLSIGTGAHGAFNSSTWLDFHSGTYNSDNVIRIDTDARSEFHFTTFELNESWTIRPTGSQSLTIYVQGHVNIAGVIDCSGDDGNPAVSTLSSPPDGGRGRCGGADGGRGQGLEADNVTVIAAGDGGTSGTGNPTGYGRKATAARSGGGGGGGYSETGVNDPTAGGGGGGAAGVNTPDHTFTLVGGGAGGGGGGRFYAVADPGNSTGASGGAGGGSIYIYSGGSLTVTSTGKILANGGDGGSVASPLKGGGGGGGGGGSIKIWTAGRLLLNGAVEARFGNSGTAQAGAGAGGSGGDGRTWVTDSDGISDSDTATFEYPAAILSSAGTAGYETGALEAVSTLVDFEHTHPKLNSVSYDATVPAGSSVTVLVAASDEPFSADEAQWVPVTDLARAEKRYLRVKLLLASQSQTEPVRLRSVTIDYERRNLEKFEFEAGGCGRVRGSSFPPAGAIPLVLLPMMLVWIMRRRARLTS